MQFLEAKLGFRQNATDLGSPKWWLIGKGNEWDFSLGAEKSTPPETNMEPKNGGWEEDFPFQLGDF